MIANRAREAPRQAAPALARIESMERLMYASAEPAKGKSKRG